MPRLLGGKTPWMLGEEWVETKPLSYQPIALHSRSHHGVLHHVSKSIGGKPLGLISLSTEISRLLGCFVRKEMSPRFLATLDWEKEITVYIRPTIRLCFNPQEELFDESFEPSLTTLKTRLWRVQ